MSFSLDPKSTSIIYRYVKGREQNSEVTFVLDDEAIDTLLSIVLYRLQMLTLSPTSITTGFESKIAGIDTYHWSNPSNLLDKIVERCKNLVEVLTITQHTDKYSKQRACKLMLDVFTGPYYTIHTIVCDNLQQFVPLFMKSVYEIESASFINKIYELQALINRSESRM